MKLASQTADQLVRSMYERYWPEGTPRYLIEAETARYAHMLSVVSESVPAGGTVVDIGGGWGVFSAACAALGYHAVNVDYYQGFGDVQADRRYELPRDYGAEILVRDVATSGVDYPPNSIDAFTCFHSIEHWHVGPKKAFHSMMAALKPGGLFYIAGPNANDFAKRITVPLGLAEWAMFEEWYEQPFYRSHVHELTLNDFYRVAADLGLQDVSIYGRNSSAFLSPKWIVRVLCRPLDYLFRLRPSLCTEIYLRGKKPQLVHAEKSDRTGQLNG